MNKEALILAQDAVSRAKLEHRKDWLDMKDEHSFEGSGETLRKHGAAFKWLEDNGIVIFADINPSDYTKPSYKEVTEIVADGQQKSDRLIEMSEAQKKDEKYILEAHGYNPDEWEIVNAKHSIYNVNAKGGITKTLYSSKITVKKRVSGFNTDKFIKEFSKNLIPEHVDTTATNGEGMLEITYKDMHWGIADYQYYKPVLDKTIRKIKSQPWQQILIVVGSDLLHNDGFTGQTTSGTIIDKVNMEKAWNEAFLFYSLILKEALRNSENVQVMFCEGNHDQAMGWAFVRALEAKFPPEEQTTYLAYDTARKTRKAFVWKGIFLGITHGDKAYNKLSKNFLTEFGKLIANASIVEIHHGHIHHETMKDEFGIVTRSLASGAKTDDYHYENGYIGAKKRFQLFEYSEHYLEGVKYINI